MSADPQERPPKPVGPDAANMTPQELAEWIVEWVEVGPPTNRACTEYIAEKIRDHASGTVATSTAHLKWDLRMYGDHRPRCAIRAGESRDESQSCNCGWHEVAQERWGHEKRNV